MIERLMGWFWRAYLRICRKRIRPEYDDTNNDGETGS